MKCPRCDRPVVCAHCEHVPLSDPRANERHGIHAAAPETSHIANERAFPKSGTAKMLALRSVVSAGERGCAAFEVELGAHKHILSVAPSFTLLKKGGWIEDSGMRRVTPRGQPAVVWVLTPRGREMWDFYVAQGWVAANVSEEARASWR